MNHGGAHQEFLFSPSSSTTNAISNAPTANSETDFQKQRPLYFSFLVKVQDTNADGLSLSSSFIDANVQLLLQTDRADSIDKVSRHENWSIEGEISGEELDDLFLLLRALAWNFYVRRGVTIKPRWATFSCPENEPVQLQVWSLIGVDNRRACSLLLGELEYMLSFPKGHLQNGGLEAGLSRLEDWFGDRGFAYNRYPTTPRDMTAAELREAPKRLFELSSILQLPPLVPMDRLDNIQVLIAAGFVFVGCYGSSETCAFIADALRADG